MHLSIVDLLLQRERDCVCGSTFMYILWQLRLTWHKQNNAHTIKRWTSVLFSCPIRCTRLIACASAAGFSSGSIKTTCCASKRLRPLAPCWIRINNTWKFFDGGCWAFTFIFSIELFCPLNLLMATCAFLYLQSQNNYQYE